MKYFITAIILVAFAVPAFAAGNGSNAFALYSAASGATKTSAAVSVRAFKTKTLSATGATLASNAASATFQNMSGTLTVECAPATAGPWSTCIANDYAQTAISRTTNGQFTWADASPYVRIKWIAGTVGTKLKVFLNWIEN
jgi:hypothetical protein